MLQSLPPEFREMYFLLKFKVAGDGIKAVRSLRNMVIMNLLAIVNLLTITALH